MTEAGWTRGEDAAEAYADKAAIEAVWHVLGAHKLTCDEHENLQQDFKDVALEAYQQGRVAGLEEAKNICDKLYDSAKGKNAEYYCALLDVSFEIAQQAQGGV